MLLLFFIQRSGRNLSGWLKYSSTLLTTKCGNITWVYNRRHKQIIIIFLYLYTPLGTWCPARIASDCKLLPLPIITGYILKVSLSIYCCFQLLIWQYLKVSLMHAFKYGMRSWASALTGESLDGNALCNSSNNFCCLSGFWLSWYTVDARAIEVYITLLIFATFYFVKVSPCLHPPTANPKPARLPIWDCPFSLRSSRQSKCPLLWRNRNFCLTYFPSSAWCISDIVYTKQ